MYSVLCILGVFFVIGYVPETKGRDLDSIANLFLKQNDKECVVAVNGLKRKGEGTSTAQVEITRL